MEVEEVEALNTMKSRLREKREAKEEATFGSAHARPKVAY